MKPSKVESDATSSIAWRRVVEPIENLTPFEPRLVGEVRANSRVAGPLRTRGRAQCRRGGNIGGNSPTSWGSRTALRSLEVRSFFSRLGGYRGLRFRTQTLVDRACESCRRLCPSVAGVRWAACQRPYPLNTRWRKNEARVPRGPAALSRSAEALPSLAVPRRLIPSTRRTKRRCDFRLRSLEKRLYARHHRDGDSP
jgi:hypothetical protein